MPARALHRWHRRAGVAAAAFLVFLLATGVPLQFSAALELGQRHVTWDAILDWYALEPPREVWQSGGLVSVGDGLFLAGSGDPVAPLGGFRGAVPVQGLIVAAGGSEVLLLSVAPTQLIDRFPMPSTVARIGRYREQVVVGTAQGLLLADPDLVNWQPVDLRPADVSWATLEPPADPELYRQQFRQQMLTLERLLQDAHSGRLLGTPGIVLVDAASVLLTFLALSGLIMWWRSLGR